MFKSTVSRTWKILHTALLPIEYLWTYQAEAYKDALFSQKFNRIWNTYSLYVAEIVSVEN